jgi:hypothetical protein
MKKLFGLLLLLSPLAHAAPVVTTWRNPECQTGECELRGVKFSINKEVDHRNKNAGNSLMAEIETTRKDQLKNYAFVQYIRGCHFVTDVSGSVSYGRRDFFGKSNQLFKHVGWHLDSAMDTDPVYWSYAEAGQDGLRGYEVPRNASYLTDDFTKTENYDWWAGKVKNLKSAKIYAADNPTPSSWDIEGVKIKAVVSSLEFKICVHRMEDIPQSVTSSATVIPGALFCFEWDSNYQMNFSRGQLEERKGLHPACVR